MSDNSRPDSAEWYVHRDGQNYGPYSRAALDSWRETSAVESDWIWHPLRQEWVALVDFELQTESRPPVADGAMKASVPTSTTKSRPNPLVVRVGLLILGLLVFCFALQTYASYRATEVWHLSGLSFDGKRIILCADNRVNVFDPTGQQTGSFGSTDAVEFGGYITAEGAPDGTIWVADMQNRKVHHFSADGKWLRSIGSEGSGPGKFNHNIRTRISPKGELWVLDTTEGEVERYTSDGQFLDFFPPSALPQDTLQAHNYPRDVAWGPDGKIYIAEHSAGCVNVYRSTGEWVRSFSMVADTAVLPATWENLAGEERNDGPGESLGSGIHILYPPELEAAMRRGPLSCPHSLFFAGDTLCLIAVEGSGFDFGELYYLANDLIQTKLKITQEIIPFDVWAAAAVKDRVLVIARDQTIFQAFDFVGNPVSDFQNSDLGRFAANLNFWVKFWQFTIDVMPYIFGVLLIAILGLAIWDRRSRNAIDHPVTTQASSKLSPAVSSPSVGLWPKAFMFGFVAGLLVWMATTLAALTVNMDAMDSLNEWGLPLLGFWIAVCAVIAKLILERRAARAPRANETIPAAELTPMSSAARPVSWAFHWLGCFLVAFLVHSHVFASFLSLAISILMAPDSAVPSTLKVPIFFAVQLTVMGSIIMVCHFKLIVWERRWFRSEESNDEFSLIRRFRFVSLGLGAIATLAVGANLIRFVEPQIAMFFDPIFLNFGRVLTALAFGTSVAILLQALALSWYTFKYRTQGIESHHCVAPVILIVILIHWSVVPANGWLRLVYDLPLFTLVWAMASYLASGRNLRAQLRLFCFTVPILLLDRGIMSFVGFSGSSRVIYLVFGAALTAHLVTRTQRRAFAWAGSLLIFSLIGVMEHRAMQDMRLPASDFSFQPMGIDREEFPVAIQLRGHVMFPDAPARDASDVEMVLINELYQDTIAVFRPMNNGAFVLVDTRSIHAKKGYQNATFALKITAPGRAMRYLEVGRLFQLMSNDLGAVILLPDSGTPMQTSWNGFRLRPGESANPPYDSHPLIRLEIRLREAIDERNSTLRDMARSSSRISEAEINAPYRRMHLDHADSEFQELRQLWPPPLPLELRTDPSSKDSDNLPTAAIFTPTMLSPPLAVAQ